MTGKLQTFHGISRRVAVTLWAMLLLVPAAWGANPQFEEGKAAFLKGDTEAALALWLPLANQGDADAQFAIGTMYYTGRGLPLNHTESAYWYHRAAEQGLAAAQYNLGNAYKRGEGVPQNNLLAVRWWKKAVEQDFGPAQFNLASAYIEGAGVEKDQEQAVSLYRQAAKNGHQPAIDLLARLEADQDAIQPGCEAWLTTQSASSFTIQLVSTTQQESAEQLAQRHDLADYHICSYDVGGKVHYALMVGAYADSVAAQEAVERLPSELRAGKPWIRKISVIKQLVAHNEP
jgi:TPR repeat protein